MISNYSKHKLLKAFVMQEKLIIRCNPVNNNNIRNWPLPIGAFQDQCKQIVINKHNMVKNPNWREADQLAIYKRRREVELGATENNIS